MRSFLQYFVFILIILSGCKSSRENRILIVYDSPDFELDLARDVIKSAKESDSLIDSVEFSNTSRLGDEILKYMGVLMLVDPNKIDAQWQTDIERYIQSGGGILMPNLNVNEYHWSWMKKARTTNSEVFEGGKVTFYEVGEDSGNITWEQMQTCFYFDCVDFDNITTEPTPDWNRFTTKVLDADINEPMELAILPSGKVIFIEREGNFKLFDPETSKTKILNRFNISTKGNYEDGMLGLTLDPNYEDNNWIYLYYSPYGGHGRQNLSRFVLAFEDSLILSSEKILLEVPVQRETCCHSGGSINFDAEGNLFLSTGDNTSSKESDGYSPLDERPGRGPFDAQKGSSNTHDLRGKILKITPQDDGTYTIPDGNLFPKDGSKGRPEIYAMGTRNPFRFSVDQKTGYVFWGDVGPDGGKDGELGPQSYDEWNIAKSPGNYGWPYFVADNKGYPMYDFETGEIGAIQDPQNPINESPNNYGDRELPPARIPLIWYPYGESELWPMLGTGSRSAMSGPVYYVPNGYSEVNFPNYYNGKLFIYEWARSWIKVVSFDKDWNVSKIEPFLPEFEISKPIDIEFDKEGSMYILEYGANYFANNNDARLVKIEYSEGNRLPIAQMDVSKPQGAVPLLTEFDASNSYDFDEEDELSFEWTIGDNTVLGSTISHTFKELGEFEVTLAVSDQKGGTTTVNRKILVGNEPPMIDVNLDGNKSFFFGSLDIDYEILVSDLEDGSINNGIEDDEVVVVFNYLENSNDLALLGEDFYQGQIEHLEGKALIESSDCKSCHDPQENSIGPSYMSVSQKYATDYDAPLYLSDKIIKGGSGNWGKNIMAAHPQHTKEEAIKMVSYILAIGQESTSKPLQGTFELRNHDTSEPKGLYGIGVQYTDKGSNNLPPIRSRELILLRPPLLQAEDHDSFKDVQQQRPNGGELAYVSGIQNGSFLGFNDIDLSGLSSFEFRIKAFQSASISVRIDAIDGPEISRVVIDADSSKKWWEVEWTDVNASIKQTEDIHQLYFVFESDLDGGLLHLDYIGINQK